MSVAAPIMTTVYQPPTTRPRYPSDLSDTAWWRICGLVVPKHERGGRPCSQARWREYVNVLLYIARTGIPWRALPHDFTVTWSAAHKHFTRWTKTGLWKRLMRVLREEARTGAGRTAKPTAAIVDSSSVKGMPVAGPRGFDGAKKIDGIKRHILVDTTGLLLGVHATAANVQDRAAFADLLTVSDCATVRKVWADKGYTGTTPARGRHGGRDQAGHRLRTQAHRRVHRPAPPLGRGTHQRVDQPPPTPRAPVRDHPGRPRRLPHPVPDRAPATPTRQGTVA